MIEDQNIYDLEQPQQARLIQRIVKKSQSTLEDIDNRSLPTEIGYISRIDYQSAYNYAHSPVCRLYSVLPHSSEKIKLLAKKINEFAKKANQPSIISAMQLLMLEALPRHTDNCGSYTLKAAAHALGKPEKANSIASTLNFIAPDQVMPILEKMGGIDFSFSQPFAAPQQGKIPIATENPLLGFPN